MGLGQMDKFLLHAELAQGSQGDPPYPIEQDLPEPIIAASKIDPHTVDISAAVPAGSHHKSHSSIHSYPSLNTQIGTLSHFKQTKADGFSKF